MIPGRGQENIIQVLEDKNSRFLRVESSQIDFLKKN